MQPKTHYHLAQANIAKMIAPLDDPAMKGFVDQLGEINRIADERNATTVDDLLAWLEEHNHPALVMDMIF